MRYVSYDGYDVNPAGSYNRDRGYSMRCVAKVSEFGSGDYEWVDDINTHTIDEDGTLTLRIELDPQALLEVVVDGQVVDPELYELLDGEETLIQFKAEYLDTLDEGEHPVTAVYQEGVIVETEMIIMRAPIQERPDHRK